MIKFLSILVILAFIGSINIVSADDLMRFRFNGNSIYDQPYGDRNEFPCPDRLGSCTITDSDYTSTRKGQLLEVFNTVDEAKQHLNFNPQLPSGLEGLRPVHVSIVDRDVLQVVYAYKVNILTESTICRNILSIVYRLYQAISEAIIRITCLRKQML